MQLAIIGDFNPDFPSHVATNDAIRHAAQQLNIEPVYQWVIS